MPCPLQPNNILLKLQTMKPHNLAYFFSCSLYFLSQILKIITRKTAYRVFVSLHNDQNNTDFIELVNKFSGLKVYILI